MLRQTVLPLCLMAALALAAGAHAAPRAAGHNHGGPAPDAPSPDAQPHVPVGYDAAYDYSVANDPDSDADPYYQYMGPPPTDPRSREQEGLRDGRLPIAPRTPYYAGVRIYGADYYGYGYGYGHNCGCEHYGRRYTVYYDDFGIRGASYPGYDDRPHTRYGRGYGD